MSPLDQLVVQPEYRLFRSFFAENTTPLVLVIGSGLSVPAGLPSWRALRSLLEREAANKIAGLTQIGAAFSQGRLEAATAERDPWVAFKMLKGILAAATYENIVSGALRRAEEVERPPAYDELLRLSPRGVVTLNLDRFAGDALSKRYPGREIAAVYGFEIANKWRVIRNAPCFLVYLHGRLHDSSSWVLDIDQFSRLRKKEGHRYLLDYLYADCLVLFVGVSVDDVALSGRLLSLTAAGFKPDKLFWLTPRVDSSTRQWADENRISLINYHAPDDQAHTDVIKALVSDCWRFVPRDEVQLPLSSARPPDATHQLNTDPGYVSGLSPNEIREALNQILSSRLYRASTQEQYAAFTTFCEEYERALHNAFFRSARNDQWFHYRLNFPALGSGSFGEVYMAEDLLKPGDLVAVKIMRQHILENAEMLQGFRRGVRSMELLQEHGVRGMVPIREAFEIPPTIVMEYVPGAINLEECVLSWGNWSWATRITLARKVAEIVFAGHKSPGMVYHRDLKPSNILVTNMVYETSFDPHVVVLDFDMSWHKGSEEKDVVFESRDDFGYLAPEQTSTGRSVGARSARVDSYGLGMTLFFLFGHEHPRPNEGLSGDWYQRALTATKSKYDCDWASLPCRLARLIVRLTKIRQAERIDLAPALHELSLLANAASDSASVESAAVVAEECLARSVEGGAYEWDDEASEGTRDLGNGLLIRTSGKTAEDTISLKVAYTEMGFADRKTLHNKISAAVAHATRQLTEHDWRIVAERRATGEALLEAVIERGAVLGHSASALSAGREVLATFKRILE